MKTTAILLAIVYFCLLPNAAESRQIESANDGSVLSAAQHWAANNPDRLNVQSTDYGGNVPNGDQVLYTPTIPNSDGTLPAPFLVSPLFKSILDAVLKPMALNGGVPTILQSIEATIKAAVTSSLSSQDPGKVTPPAQAAQAAAGQQAGDSAGGAAKDNAAGAIDFCSRYLKNFASDGGNRWNKVRDSIFMPIAILLLLPGAVLAQVKAIAAAGNPVLGSVNPFDGILRSIVAIFLIPGTYLAISFGIDFSNCVSFTISDQYTRLFGSNMYKDALCGQMRAMPTNGASASAGNGPVPPWPNNPDIENQNFGNGSPDPCGGAPADANHVNEAMPAHVVYSRLAVYGANAASTTAWNILCAFQMAYLCYLYLVGPIVAALWVWPVKQLRDAFPSWIEGVITLCFWSMFWNTTILLMACFKDYGTTGTYIFTALNFLATSCVKYAFDFAGLVSAAGQEAAQKATQPASGAGGGGGGNHSNNSAGKPTKTLPAGYHVSTANGHLIATDGQGHSMTFDNATGMWTPTVGGGAGGAGGGGEGGGGGAGDHTAGDAGSAKPVLVDHAAPPINKGSTDIPLGNGDHLKIWTDENGQRHWALLDKDGKSPLAVGDLQPGQNTIDLSAQLGAGATLSINDSLIASHNAANDAYADTATLTLPGVNGGPSLTETATLTPNADGSEHITTTESTGNGPAQTLLDADIKPSMEYHASNGDTIMTSPLGTSGMEAVTVVGADGKIEGTWVVPAPRAGEAPQSIALDNGNVLSLGIGTDGSNTLSFTSGAQNGQGGTTDSWSTSITASGDQSIQYNGPSGAFTETISASTGADGSTTFTSTFTDSATHAVTGSEIDVYNPNNGIPSVTSTLLDASGAQVMTEQRSGNSDVITIGSASDIQAGNYETISQTANNLGSYDTDQKTYANGVVTSETQNSTTLAGSDSLTYTNGVLSAEVKTTNSGTETYQYDGRGGYTETITNAQGQTIGTVTDVVNANGTHDMTTTQAINFQGNADTLTAVSHYDSAGNLVSVDQGVIKDANGQQVGTVSTVHNSDGSFTATQADMQGHVVATEQISTLGANSPYAGATLDTVTTYGADGSYTVASTTRLSDGTVVDTATAAYNSQHQQLSSSDISYNPTTHATTYSSDNMINGSAVTVSQNGQGGATVAMNTGTHDAVTYTDTAGGSSFTFALGNGTTETMNIAASGAVTLTDQAGNAIQATVTSNTATGTYTVNDGQGHIYTVAGNETAGFTAQISQANQPAETFNLGQADYYHNGYVNNGNAQTYTSPVGWMTYSSENGGSYSSGAVGNAAADIVVSAANVQIAGGESIENRPGTYTVNGNTTVTIAPSAHGSETITVRTADGKMDTYVVNPAQGQMVKNNVAANFASPRRPNVPAQPASIIPARIAQHLPQPTLPTSDANAPETANNGGGGGGNLEKNGSVDEDGFEGDVSSLDQYSENAEADALYKPGTQSLERQMMDAKSAVRTLNAFNSILQQPSLNKGETLPDAIVSATVDQNMATLMVGQGKYNQAEQLYTHAISVMQNYPQAPEYKILLETYANYLSKRGRELEANEYRRRITSTEVVSNSFEVASV
ncbi:MAG: RHS repeat protein [Cyanobacteria bacterium SZAS-4]|nr:RHS repeat protein [Cyanobacteria bacterium SZAS-4]